MSDDVSWTLLRRIVRDWLGESVDLTGVRPLHGGSMSTTLLLKLKGRDPVVLKIAPHMVVHQYEEEAYQLNLLNDWGLPVPEVLACKVGSLDDPHSFLLMQNMPGIPLAVARESLTEDEFHHVEMHLADLVLSLHARTDSAYKKVAGGWEQGTHNYPEFFHSIYDPILRDVIDMKALPATLKRRVLSIHEKVDGMIQHADRPRLVHGDLWGSNLLAGKDKAGKWWITGILDPNCRFSHFEVEMAYLELFKTVTPAFFRAYEQSHRLSDEYRLYRRDVYMMYPLLNHIRLFGKQYVRPLGVIADRVAKSVTTLRRMSARKVA